MYGHAAALLTRCAAPDCPRPATIRTETSGALLCAAHGLTALTEETHPCPAP